MGRSDSSISLNFPWRSTGESMPYSVNCDSVTIPSPVKKASVHLKMLKTFKIAMDRPFLPTRNSV